MTETAKNIGCIGAGNMGGAILARLSTAIDPGTLYAYDIDREKLDALVQKYRVSAVPSPESLAIKSDIIIIAVKPDCIESVLTGIWGAMTPEKIIVSIAAGVSLMSLENILGSHIRIVRVMSNTPAIVGEGMSVLSPNGNIDEQSLVDVERIFSLIGKALVLPEKFMDAVTGLSGSGPAFVFTFIQGLTDGGVKLGLPRDKALMLAAQTVLGSARYVLESGEEPMTLRGKVTSPGGTTIEGIHILERSGFAGIVMDAVERAAIKSRRLGEK